MALKLYRSAFYTQPPPISRGQCDLKKNQDLVHSFHMDDGDVMITWKDLSVCLAVCLSVCLYLHRTIRE